MNSYKQGLFSVLLLNHEYKGYYIPQEHWNGWACPAFERSEAEAIVNETNAMCDQYGPDQCASFKWNGDVLEHVYTTPVDEDMEPEYVLIHPTEIMVDGKQLTVYPIANRYWCWSVS